MKRKNIEISLLIFYIILLFIGVILSNSIITLLASSVAIFTFLFVQQISNRKLDERDHFISKNAGWFSFQIILIVLIFLDVFSDFVNILEFISLDHLLTILVGLSFITYSSNHIYYKYKH